MICVEVDESFNGNVEEMAGLMGIERQIVCVDSYHEKETQVVCDESGKIKELKVVWDVNEEEEALVNNSYISQYAVVGEKVVFKGGATGGSGEYQYAYYYRKTSDSSWTTAGTEWGTSIYATAKPGTNTVYEVCIKVRDANNTSNIVKKYLSFAANNT